MKKIFIVIILAFASLHYWYYNEGKLGKGDYFLYYSGYDAIRSFANKKLHLSYILDVKYNDNYIIAIRYPLRYFNCPDEKIFFDKALSYIVIDKKSNTVYSSYNKNNFDKFIRKQNIKIFFTNREYEKATSRFEKIRKKLDKTLLEKLSIALKSQSRI